MKSILVCLALSISNFAHANPTIVCENKNKSDLHLFKVTISDEVVKIDEKWEGPYKTSDNLVGLVEPIGTALLLKFPDKGGDVNTAILTRYADGTANFQYQGFLSPDNDGQVTMICD